MTCVQLSEPDADQAEPEQSCSWASIARGVRIRAMQVQAEADDLFAWADFLDGVAELEARRD